MTIARIYISPARGDAPQECAQVEVIAGKGIVGDRYFDRHDEPGQNITLIEAEELEAFCTEFGLPCDLSISHRNLVTRDVRLNALVGQEFMIGTVRLRGVELCEPCPTLGQRIASVDLSPATVVKRLTHRAGLRADVLSSGLIATGAMIKRANSLEL